jgi:hypothetical protein
MTIPPQKYFFSGSIAGPAQNAAKKKSSCHQELSGGAIRRPYGCAERLVQQLLSGTLHLKFLSA